MKLYIDKESNQFITEPTFKTPVNTVSFKRGDAAKVEIVFVESNTALSATNGRNIIFGIKQNGKYDGALVVSTSAYTVSGNSYILRPSFNTESLNSLLSSGDGNDSNDVAALNAMLEITWSDDGTDWFSSNTITAVINNDVIKGTEGTPLELTSPESWFDNRLALTYTAPTIQPVLPTDQTLMNFRIRIPSLEVDRAGVSYFGTDATGRGMFSDQEGGVISSSGQCCLVYYDGTDARWKFDVYYDGSLFDAYLGPFGTYSPNFGSWVDDVVFEELNYYSYTDGKLGQIFISDDASSIPNITVWLCVSEQPVLWKQISNFLV